MMNSIGVGTSRRFLNEYRGVFSLFYTSTFEIPCSIFDIQTSSGTRTNTLPRPLFEGFHKPPALPVVADSAPS